MCSISIDNLETKGSLLGIDRSIYQNGESPMTIRPVATNARLIACLLVLLTLANSSAATTVVDFESVPSSTLVGDRFLSLGLRVRGIGNYAGLVLSEGDFGISNFGNSPTHVMHIGDREQPTKIEFVDPNSPSIIVGATSFSILMGDGNRDSESFTVSYFDVNGFPLGTPNEFTTHGDGMLVSATSVNLGAPIGSVELRLMSSSASGAASDDLEFSLASDAFEGIDLSLYECSRSSILNVQKAYISYYGRPGDFAGIKYWCQRLDDEGGSLDSIMEAFGVSDEFLREYGHLSHEELIYNIYEQLFNREPDPDGFRFYLNQLSSGRMTLQTITLSVLFGATGTDVDILVHKQYVALYHSSKESVAVVSGLTDVHDLIYWITDDVIGLPTRKESIAAIDLYFSG
jgi:hypothetical protein